jgi:hypothetical protein
MTILKKWTILAVAMIATADVCAAQQTNQPRSQAGSNTTQNVNVVNAPTVTVGNTPTVNVGTLPPVTIGPGPLTHMGVLPGKYVMLASIEWSKANCPATKLAIFSTQGNPSCFDVNSYTGQLLMITDWEWYANTTAGSTCYVGAGVLNSPFLSVSAAAADGVATRSEHLTAGIVLAGNPTASSNCTGLALYMQGYLIPNQ